MSMITAQSMVVSVDDLSVADLDGEAVVLDPQSGKYYGLNEVGVRILELAQQPQSVSDVIEALRKEYEVDAEQLRGDVLGFLREMERNKLVQTQSSHR